tara:strand:- start:223 stop:372 length:150 start_codon:yes stop_codon:yes gene_type:complete
MTNTSNQNSKQLPETLRDQYHSWAKGFARRGMVKEYHPYTHKDFKFGKV